MRALLPAYAPPPPFARPQRPSRSAAGCGAPPHAVSLGRGSQPLHASTSRSSAGHCELQHTSLRGSHARRIPTVRDSAEPLRQEAHWSKPLGALGNHLDKVTASFHWEGETRNGTLAVERMGDAERALAVGVLFDSFAHIKGVTAGMFTRRHEAYERQRQTPVGVVLVGKLPGGEVVGTCEVVFSTSSAFEPGSNARCTYICNLAVAERARRAGVGTALLLAGEALSWECGTGTVYLKTRVGDSAAAGLYQRSGYAVVEEEGGGLFGGLGRPRRCLMKKALAAGITVRA